MKCPACGEPTTSIAETRCFDGERVDRRRVCACGARWSTREQFIKGTMIKGPTLTTTTGVIQEERRQNAERRQGERRRATRVQAASLFPESDLNSDQSLPDSPDSLSKSVEIPKEMGEGGPPKRNVFAEVLGQFSALWSAQYGFAYLPTAADRNQLGRTLNQLEPNDLRALEVAFKAYLADRSVFVVETQRHSLAFFCTSGGLNKYRATTALVAAQRPAQAHARNFTEEANNTTRQAYLAMVAQKAPT